MAIYNEILVGRYNRALQKLFAIKASPPVRQLGGEVLPTIEVDNLYNLENRLTAQLRTFAFNTNVAAGGAGNRAGFRLRNPPGSGALGIIEKIVLGNSLIDQPLIQLGGPVGTGDLTTSLVGLPRVRDTRLGPINSALIPSSSGIAALVGTAIYQVNMPANTFVDVILFDHHEWVIAPGDLMTIYANVLNQGLSISIMWRERALEESEAT
jgi:hypothetical protein